ncbi:MAG: nucleotidyltransferase domain-containing protein [Nitrospinae bacterium]|nr:nucleotidyltransferase domain-containing protein [Nitrospinota bacterium]
MSYSMPGIDLNPHDLEEVKRILRAIAPEYDVWAFGSRVDGTAKAYSDLDLAVIAERPLPLSLKADLKEAFDESGLAIRVDIIDWASVRENFRAIIERKKVMVQEGGQISE